MSDDLQQFIEEAVETLDGLEQNILKLEEGVTPELIDAIMRDYHSLKGTSSFFNLPQVQGLCHISEGLVSQMKSDGIPYSDSIGEALLVSIDSLRTLLVDYESSWQHREVSEEFIDSIITLTDFNFLCANKHYLPSTSQKVQTESEGDIHQLIYTSHTEEKMDTVQLINILKVARKNNTEKNVSGMLIYRDRVFMQLLEGKKYQVEEIFKKIKDDSRHRDVTVFVRQNVSRRSFPEWTMGFYMMKCMRKANIPGLNNMFLENFEWSGDKHDLAAYLLKSFKQNTEDF